MWWLQPCAVDRVSRADELSFKTWIKDTFFFSQELPFCGIHSINPDKNLVHTFQVYIYKRVEI